MNYKNYSILFVILFLIFISPSMADTRALQLQEGWNLFSLPLNKTVSDADLLKNCSASSSVYQYNQGTYGTTNTLKSGSGYWVKVSSPCAITIDGSSISINDFPSLKAGQNLIGSLSQSTKFSDIKGNCNVLSGPTKYNPITRSYENVSTIEPGFGYWVKVGSDCKLGGGVVQTCSDGTSYGQCSSTKPKYCDNGNLINKCSQCSCPSGYSCKSDGTCLSNLVGYWKFDEGSGTKAYDYSPFKNNATLFNSPVWTTGKSGKALQFNGSNYVEAPDSSSLDLSSQVTITAWINPSSTGAYNRIVAKSHTSNVNPWTMYGLLFDNSNHLRLEIATNGSQNAVNGVTTIPLNAWTFVAGTYNGSTMKVYVNGVLDNSYSHTGLIDTNKMPLSIGRSGFNSDYFKGMIDEVKVWNRALTADEIKKEYGGVVTECTPASDIIKQTDYPIGSCLPPSTPESSYEWSHSTCGSTKICKEGYCKLVNASLTSYTLPSSKYARSDSISIPYTIKNVGDVPWCLLTETQLTKADSTNAWRGNFNSISTANSASDSLSYPITCSDPLGTWSGLLYTYTDTSANGGWKVWGTPTFSFSVAECLNNEDCANCLGSGYACDSTNKCNKEISVTPGGLRGEYYDNIDFTNSKLNRTDSTVNFNWSTGSPDSSIGVDTFSVRWQGYVKADYSETYTFYVTTDDGSRVWIDNNLVIDSWIDQAATERSGSIALTAGWHSIKYEYYENAGAAVAKLSYFSMSVAKQIIPSDHLGTSGAVQTCDSTCKAQGFTSGTCEAGTSSPSGMLHVCGTNLCDENGNKVVLRAVQYDYNAMTHEANAPPGGWFQLNDVQSIKSHGGNAMELHMMPINLMMPQAGVIDESWFVARLDKYTSWCEQTQLYCIISMPNFDNPWWIPSWLQKSGESQYQASIDFWDTNKSIQENNRQYIVQLLQFIANRYKNNKYVMFGLINEPFAGNTLINEGNAKHLSYTYARIIERFIDAIRSTGAQQPIFVDKPYVWWYIYDNSVDQVNRDNIVWEDHLYVGEGSDNFDSFKSVMNTYVQRYVYNFNKPFYVGEYGFIDYSMTGGITHNFPNWKQVLQDEVNFLKSLPLAGYSWHEYPILDGEWYDWYYTSIGTDCFTPAESDWILNTTLGGSSTTTTTSTSCQSGESPIGQDGCSSGLCCCKSDLVGYWKFDEGSGTKASDSSPFKNNATLYNNPVWTTGKSGKALQFNGSNYVEAPDSSSLDLSSQVTITAWINPSSIGAYKRIVAKSYTSNANPWTEYGLLFDGANHLRLEIATGGTQNAVNGVTTIPLNTWTFVAGTYNGSTMKVYVNGVLDNSTSHSGAIDTDSMPLSIGRSGFGSDYFKGMIDEVKVWNRALTADEIKREYNGTILTNWYGSGEVLYQGQNPSNINSVLTIWQDTLQRESKWKFNVLRIPITPTYDENLVTQVIGFARSHGMKVILDLHNDQAKDWAAGYLGSDAWINFWKNMATKYKGNPDVIAFELFNEAFFTGTWNSSIQTNIDVFAKAFARCTDAIRQIDPTRAVIWSDPYAGNILPYKDWINSPYPASLLESLRPYTNNMYFAFHDYPPIDPISGKDWTGIQKFLEAMAYVKQHGFNVWLGEFGPDNYGASTPFSIDEERQFVLRCINYCIDNNIGFSLWEYRNNHYMTNLGYPNFYDEVLTQSKYVP